MKENFKNIFEPFLTNEIVINWVSPIFTGLLVFFIPLWLAKLFQNKRDERKVNDANQRLLDAIRPYIIQEIPITDKIISDIRKVVVKESGVKDKYLYSELSLRNKLIMDINESKYIDEKNKEKMIKFTYEIFKSFDNKNQLSNDQSDNVQAQNIISKIINMPIIVFLLSMIFMIIAVFLNKNDTELSENPLFLLPFLLGFISVISIMLNLLSFVFESKITKNQKESDFHNYLEIYSVTQKLRNYIAHYNNDLSDKNKNKNKKNNQ